MQKTLSLKILMFVAIVFGIHNNMQAQKHPDVIGKGYDLMLSQLLSHSVSEQGVDDVIKRSDLVFLDARELEEYNVSHIDSAIWVGYNDFDISRIEGLPLDTAIVVYCSVGYRSEKIAEKLIAAGYTDVVNLYGGIFDWVNREQTVYDSSGTTQNVHAFDKSWGVWLKNGKKVYK